MQKQICASRLATSRGFGSLCYDWFLVLDRLHIYRREWRFQRSQQRVFRVSCMAVPIAVVITQFQENQRNLCLPYTNQICCSLLFRNFAGHRFRVWGAFMNSVILLATWLRENKNIESIQNEERTLQIQPGNSTR